MKRTMIEINCIESIENSLITSFHSVQSFVRNLPRIKTVASDFQRSKIKHPNIPNCWKLM